jgi:UDP-N-acetyl-D-mannosaminuronic acid dehydrogenase
LKNFKKNNKVKKMSQKENKRVCVVGLGYIGLPSATLLANSGYKVYGVDISQSVVDTINRGKTHIIEPNLSSLVKEVVENGQLKAYLKPIEADIFIIAVPTPFQDGYIPNIDYVVEATKSIIPYIEEGNIVILESTSPIGTTEKIKELMEQGGIDTTKIYIAYCPERVLPGKIIKELVENDRIVGGITPEATKKIAEFYRTFVKGEVLESDAKTAEMAKLTENSFRDVNIAFANELSILCDKFDIDVWELRELANRHPRVNILYPSVGVGGHCIAVDPWFIVHAGGEEAKIIRTAREVNSYKTEWVIEKIKNEALKFEVENWRKPNIACMGLSFKPDIDDLRESPALYIAKRLSSELENIVCVEPNISLDSIENLRLVSLEEGLKNDILIFLVSHREFKDLNMNGYRVLDFCGIKSITKEI